MKSRAECIAEAMKFEFGAREFVAGGDDDIGWVEWTQGGLLSPDGPMRYRRMWSRGYDGVIRQIQICEPAPLHMPKWNALVAEAQTKLWAAATGDAAA